MTFSNEIIPLPLAGAIELHGYDFYPNLQTISFMTSYTNTNPVTFPATALKLISGYQASYRIDIRTFASIASKSAYSQAKENEETQGLRGYFNIDLEKFFNIN